MAKATEPKTFLSAIAAICIMQMAVLLCTPRAYAEELVTVKISKANIPIREIIQKAQDYILQKDRDSALKILAKAYVDNPHNKELEKAIQQTASIFLTEKGQQLFELSQSLTADDPKQALEKLKEAALGELENSMIYLATSRAFLRTGDCKQALDASMKSVELDPFNGEAKLHKLQALACLGQNKEFEKTKIELSKIKNEYELYVELVQGQVNLASSFYSLAERNFNRASQIDSHFAEVYYWLGEVNRKNGAPSFENDKKYVQKCKEIKITQQTNLEPRLCLEAKNIQDYLAKQNKN